jgi:hypothetical protein
MRRRRFALLGSLCAAALACGEEPAPRSGAAPAPPAPPVPIAGRYQVEGFTVNAGTGDNKRKISGNIVLAVDEGGSAYTATFDLETTAPGLAADHRVDVIGKGEGTIEGRTLRGSNTTQIVASTVPGIDPGFAFIPRQTSTRIVSQSVAEIAPDGSVRVTIESEGAPGENYTPTRTTLRGTRVGAAAGGAGPE